MPTDRELLHQYTQQGAETAFAELVRRHADLVYSVAYRVTCNGALAEDVAQAVFTQLAQQASKLSHYYTLIGWLHTTARHRSIDAIRGEVRRRTREHEATVMQNTSTVPEINWTEIGPLLDEAVGQLREQDRDAVLLRFFKNFSHQEVGAALGLGEDGARKRVDRALEKLREYFARNGVTATSAILATTIVQNSVQAAPVGLAARVTAPALAAAGAVTTGGIFLKILFMSTQTKLITAAIAIVIIAATVTLTWPRATQEPQLPTINSLAVNMPTATQVTKPAPAQVAPPVVAAVNPAIARASTTYASPPMALPVVVNSGQAQFTAGPQTDLSSAITTGIHFLSPPDLLSFCKTLMPPAVLSSTTSGVTLEQYVAQLSKKKDVSEKLTSMLEALNALDGKTPGLNDAGDRATFLLDPPAGGHKALIFNKVNGFWYLDGM
jgi:RNA polymerase sigma factor (sigma-70 family)